MHVGVFSLIFTTFIYSILYDTKIIIIYSGIIGVYSVINLILPSRYNSTRRKIMIATWSGNVSLIIVKIPLITRSKWVECLSTFGYKCFKCTEIFTKFQVITWFILLFTLLKHYSSQKNGTKITITHIMIKAIGVMLNQAPDLNGRISFGKVW